RHLRRAMQGRHRSVDTSEIDQLRDRSELIGGTCLELFIQNTRAYKRTTEGVEKISKGVNDMAATRPLEVTPETQQWLDERRENLKDRDPIYSPSLTPPVPWTNTGDGGYGFALEKRMS